ncbi:hypothetical protein Tco_1387887, partial [Tanacetum coccineum]
MSSPFIPIYADSFEESTGSSISLVILSDTESATAPAIIPADIPAIFPDALEVEAADVALPVRVLNMVIHSTIKTDRYEDPPSSDRAPVAPIISP